MPTESNKKHNRASRTRSAINQPDNKTILLLQKCNNCEVDLSTSSKYTICERCGGYVCLKCLGWSEETYDVLNKEKLWAFPLSVVHVKISQTNLPIF